jgi:CubicO group peptidase (beta-lactamase class C family)
MAHLRVVLVVVAGLSAVAVSGCGPYGRGYVDDGPAPAPERRVPEWEKVAPASVGLDAAALERLASTAARGPSTCLVVARDGKLAGEWYFGEGGRNSAQEVFSTTKSVASVLVGIAQDEGRLRIDDRASRWITEWRGTPSETVTVRDLLSNDSGRQWSTRLDYGRLLRARDKTAFAIGLKQGHPPGTVWNYNNSAIQTLERVLRRATGQDVAAFAHQRLFQPLGMDDTRLTTDRAGNTQVFMGMQSTCRDMARFGQLMLNQGRWNGEQLVSAEWVRESTGRPSTELNSAYGYLWWLNKRGTVAGPRAATGAGGHAPAEENSLVPGAPDRLFWAVGFGNQLVQVDPGTRTVVARLGQRRVPRPPTFGPAEASEVLKAVIR